MVLKIIFSLLLLIPFIPFSLQSMEAQQALSLETEKANNLPHVIQTGLLNVLCKQFNQMLRTQIAQQVSDEEAQQKGIDLAQPKKLIDKDKLRVIKKSGLKNRFDNDSAKTSIALANLWDAALDRYAVKTANFLKKIDTIEDDFQTSILTDEERQQLSSNSYSLHDLSQKIIPLIITKSKFECLPDTFATIMKHFFVKYATLRYGNSSDNRVLSWCSCPKAQLGDRLGVIIKILDTLTHRFPPSMCTENNPVYFGTFGAGDLLNDYLLVDALSRFLGYNYYKISCVDKLYASKEFEKELSDAFKEQLEKAGIKAITNFFPDSKSYTEFAKSSQIKNHILVTIDPGDFTRIGSKEEYVNASYAVVSLLNKKNTTKRWFRITFENLESIKIHDGIKTIAAESACMQAQTEKFSQSIAKHIMNQKFSDRAAVVASINQLVDEFNKTISKSDPDSYKSTEVVWFQDPVVDFKELVKKVGHPDMLTYLVDYGIEEVNSK